MNHQTLALLAGLTCLVSMLLNLRRIPFFGRMFRILPIPFWCYLLPMLGTTLGWLPTHSPAYEFLSRQVLPVSLMLLLVGTNLKGLGRLGPLATTLMVAGSAGTMMGGLISYWLYKRWLPEDCWGAIGALAGSWIGGSANLLAIKEAIQIQDPLIAPVLIVDALIAYSWMAALILASGVQNRWDQWVGAGSIQEVSVSPSSRGGPLEFWKGSAWLASGIGISLLGSAAAQVIGERLPPMGHVMNPATWTILIVTTSALALSLTPLARVEQAGASRLGTFLLYLLLSSIGARANLNAVTHAPTFFALGLTWIVIHGACLILVGRLLKAPLSLMATASQANIGGPISAPIVGATYHPAAASVGLLMAILGNILGTYLGLATAALAQLF